MYPELKRRRSWYSISLPLHAPSTYSGQDLQAALNENLLADLLEGVLEQIVPAGRFHLVGYSVGGFAAMNYAAKYPERVTSIVSIGGFLTGRARGIEGILQFFAKGTFFRKALFHGAYRTMQLHPSFFKLATLTYARQWRNLLQYEPLEPTIANIWPDVRHHSVEGQRAWFAYLLRMNLLDETQAIQHPTLVIAGEQDPIIPFHHQRKYATLLPNGRLRSLPGTGHVPFGEAPATFKMVLLDWLADREQESQR